MDLIKTYNACQNLLGTRLGQELFGHLTVALSEKFFVLDRQFFGCLSKFDAKDGQNEYSLVEK